MAVSENLKNAYSGANGNITVSTEEEKDYVKVTVGLTANAGIWGIKNTLSYDTEKLTLEQVSTGTLAATYEIVAHASDGEITFVGYRNQGKESYQVGSFLVLTFKKRVESVDIPQAIILQTKQAIDDKGQAVRSNLSFQSDGFTSVPPVDNHDYWTDEQMLVADLQVSLKNRSTETLTLYFTTDTLVTPETLSGWFHGAAGSLGAYERYGIEKYTATAQKYTKENVYFYTLTDRVDYYTTDEQEAAFEARLSEIAERLQLAGKSDFEKVLAVYDFGIHEDTDNDHACGCQVERGQ